MTFNRRSFLKAGLAAAVTAPVAGVHAVEYSSKIKFDKTADVVILGYGGAGACAAIEAHDAGAKVLILEKLPQGGGNTAVSSGGFMVQRLNSPTAKKTMNSSRPSAKKSWGSRTSSSV